MKYLFLLSFGFFVTIVGCGENPKPPINQPVSTSLDYESYKPLIKGNGINNTNYYYPTTPSYQYQTHRRNSYSHDYNYDVSGFDEDGNPIEGNIDVNKRGGEGYIIDKDGNKKRIEVEWSGRGQLEGTDEDGNSLDLEVDNK